MTTERSGRQILLIDDDELVCGSLRRLLLTQGCAVDVADDVLGAEALMTARVYDVVLVDPYLTTGVREAGGASVVKRIRLLQPKAAVIVLTGYESPSLIRIAKRHNVTELLAKPRSVVAIGEAINRAVAETA